MEPNEIIANLKLLGITQTQIAREAKRSLSLVNNVIYGRSKSDPVEKLIAKKLGKKANEIFPWRKAPKSSIKLIRCIYTLTKLPFLKKIVNG